MSKPYFKVEHYFSSIFQNYRNQKLLQTEVRRSHQSTGSLHDNETISSGNEKSTDVLLREEVREVLLCGGQNH